MVPLGYSHLFDEEQDPDPDKSEKLDLDPHFCEMLDPVPDPQNDAEINNPGSGEHKPICTESRAVDHYAILLKI